MTTRQIPLTQGLVAIVDEADAIAVLAYRWHAYRDGRTFYAKREIRRQDGSRTTLRLHNFLTGWSMTDHRNGDGLDNRRSNLRQATTAQNNANLRRGVRNTSGFKGVNWSKKSSVWRAEIRANGQSRFLGHHSTPEEAARAYDAAARELHGEFACLNFPRIGERGAS